MTDSQASLAVMQADMQAALKSRQDESADLAYEPQVAEESISISLSALSAISLSRVVEMAWEDRTPFAAIKHGYGLSEAEVIKVMRQQLKPSSFRLWRQRVSGRATKHLAKRSFTVGRAHCQTQYKSR